MRCKYCGGEISLEAAFCSYCGAPNEQAAGHAREMKKFRRSFENTRSSVQSSVRRFTGASIRLAVIAALIVLTVLLFILGGNAYSVRRSIIQGRSERNAPELMARMDELLQQEEFLAFSAYCSENYVDCFDNAFEKYAPVERASQAYSYLYSDIMKFAAPPEYAVRDDMITALADSLEYFYSAADMEQYEYYDGADNELNRRALNAMQERVGLLMMTYCGLSEEEAESLKDMSSTWRGVTIEGGIMRGE